MTTTRRVVLTGIASMTLLAGMAAAEEKAAQAAAAPAMTAVRPEIYAPVTLSADLSSLSTSERQMLGLFIEAGEIMDELYWRQTYGDRDALLKSITDPRTRDFVALNYGPWDRLADNAPFVPGVGVKPAGAEFYPYDMTRRGTARPATRLWRRVATACIRCATAAGSPSRIPRVSCRADRTPRLPA